LSQYKNLFRHSKRNEPQGLILNIEEPYKQKALQALQALFDYAHLNYDLIHRYGFLYGIGKS
jgi:hypothetical protein